MTFQCSDCGSKRVAHHYKWAKYHVVVCLSCLWVWPADEAHQGSVDAARALREDDEKMQGFREMVAR